MRSALDQVDTPVRIARLIAEQLIDVDSGRVFDPTVGEGSLLLAVQEVHGNGALEYVGADIDRHRVARLRERQPQWIVSEANALDPKSRSQSRAWRAVQTSCEAVVFNPPFSFRGNGGVRLELGGVQRTLSPATAYVALSLDVAKPARQMIGILPAGSFANKRDLEFWEWIERQRSLEVLRSLPRGTFPGVSASSLLIRIGGVNSGAGRLPPNRTAPPLQPNECVCVDVIRGRVQVHRHQELETLVHTRNLGADLDSVRRGSLDPRAVEGRVTLLPRVGKPDVRKVQIASGRMLLSDCVFALRALDRNVADRLHELLLESFAHLASGYAGTGAPHLTLQRLEVILRFLGFEPRQAGPSDMMSECSCGSQDRTSAA